MVSRGITYILEKLVIESLKLGKNLLFSAGVDHSSLLNLNIADCSVERSKL
jgi:hypothetical protein